MAFQNLPPPPPTKNADSSLDRWLQLMRDKISAAGAIVWSQITLPTKAANTVLAGPTTGADAQVDFRALVNDDLPVVVATKGGTGQSLYAVGDLLYASTTTALSKLADVAVASYLRSGGVNTAPLWSTLKLPNSATANRIPYATSTDTWGESAALTFNGTTLTLTANDPKITWVDNAGSPTGNYSLRSSDDTFVLRDESTGADRVTTDTSGNVVFAVSIQTGTNAGIGSAFQAVGDVTSGLSAAGGTFGGVAGITLSRFVNNSPAQNLTFGKSRGTTLGAHTVVQNGDTLGTISWYGSDGTGFISSASMRVEVDGTPGGNDMPGRMMFSTTADGASSPTERMRIDSVGNVGIGKTPSVKFDVAGRRAVTITSPGILDNFNDTTTNNIQLGTTGTAFYFNATTATDFYFASSSTECFRISTAGNITLGSGSTNAHTFNGTARLQSFTVAGLPAAGTAGRISYVTDALAPGFLTVVVGGGAVKTPVFDNGTNWVAF